MVEVAQRSPVPVGLVRSSRRPGAYALVVKVTYELGGGSQAALARDQAPLREVRLGEGGALLYPGDFVEEREACDVVLAGEVLEADGPVIAKVGSLHLRAHRAAELGPVDEQSSGRVGSFARPQARVPFPSLPLAVEVQGGGWFRSTVIAAPRPVAALVIRDDWASVSPLALQIDGIAMDPFRSRVELVMRAYFQYPADVDRDVIAIVDVTDSLPRTSPDERASWPRAPAVGPAELPELEPQETIPVLVLPAEPEALALEPAAPLVAPRSLVARPPLATLPIVEPSAAASFDDAPLPFERSKGRTAPADPRQVPGNPLPFVRPPPPAPPAPVSSPPPAASPRTQPPPPPAADQSVSDVALPFARPAPRGSITQAPPPSQAEALPFRAPPPSVPRIPFAPAAPPPSSSGLPFAVIAPPARALPAEETAVKVRVEGLTIDEYAAIRAALWADGVSRKEALKRHGLTELRWRLVERRWERHLDEAGIDALAPLVDLLAAASRRDMVANR